MSVKAKIIKHNSRPTEISTGPIDLDLLVQVERLWDRAVEGQSRSEADFAVARALATAGIPRKTISKAFRFRPYSFSRKYYSEKKKRGKPQAKHYLKRTLDRALHDVVPEDLGSLDACLLKNVIKNLPELHSIETPFELLNNFGGYIGLTTLMGPPKVGKSLACLQSACHASMLDIPTLLVDFENGPTRTFKRLKKMKYNDEFLYYMNVRKFSKEALLKRVGQLSKLGDKMFLIVDSIQKLPTHPDRLWAEIREWVLVLEQIKLLYPCIVLAISEKKREFYQQSVIGAGKGTSSIEYNSDMVLDINRDGQDVDLTIVTHRDRLVLEDESYESLILHKGKLVSQ